MNVISVLAIGLMGAFLAAFLKQYKPEYALILTVITAIFITISAIGWVVPVISEIKEIFEDANISYDALSILIKTVGICYITQLTSDVCKDSGQASIATKIELVGRIALCVSAIPLYRDVLSLVKMIIGKVT